MLHNALLIIITQVTAHVKVSFDTISVDIKLSDHSLYITDSGISDDRRSFLVTSAVIIIFLCGLYLLLEAFQIYQRRLEQYFLDPQNYFQVVTYCCVIVFVFPLGHTCWCYPSWKWQIGALALFLAWINNLVLLKHIPHVGKPITMLFNVYINFVKLIYLPVLLILTFAFPFYMLFVATMEVG